MPRSSRHRGALLVAGIVLVSAAARAAGAQWLRPPWIAPDEMIYGLLGQSLWESGELAVRGQATSHYSLLYPALVGAPLLLDDLAAGIAAVQVVQALVTSSVALVVWAWGRTFLREPLAVAAAALGVLPPALVYSGLLMSEALYYPVAVLALAALARTLAAPTLLAQGFLLAAVTVATAVRLQALVLLPVAVTAALADAAFARSTATLRRLAPALLLVGAGAAAGVAVTAASEGVGWDTLLGAYGTVADEAPGPWRVARELVWHAGGLAIVTLGLPLLAVASLTAAALRDGEPDPRARAFLAATVSYCGWLVVQVALFAAGYLEHVGERYLVSAVPPLLLGLLLWLQRGAPRPRAAAPAAAVAAVLAVAAIPVERVAAPTAAHDLFTTMPLLDLLERTSPALARAVLIGAAAAVAAAFLLLPRRLLPRAVWGLAASLAALSVVATHDVGRFSERAQEEAFGIADSDWVDRTAPAGDEPVVLVNSGDREWTTVARTLFWNRRIGAVVRLPEASAYGPIPQRLVVPAGDGELRLAGGRPLAAPLAVAPSGLLLEGEKLAEVPPTSIQPGAALWRAASPLRVRQRVDGLNPNGDFGRPIRVTVYACAPGALELTLIGKSGAPVDVAVDGLPVTTIRAPADAVWQGSVPAPPYADGTFACTFELDPGGLVGSTRIEFVPAG